MFAGPESADDELDVDWDDAETDPAINQRIYQ